ncbi:MAG: hypothetical protein R6V41_00790 [Desulfobacteraceae bacterium]
MCESNNCCLNPEMLKDAPDKCTYEQIRECHGDVNGHPCTDSNQQSENKQEQGPDV